MFIGCFSPCDTGLFAEAPMSCEAACEELELEEAGAAPESKALVAVGVTGLVG